VENPRDNTTDEADDMATATHSNQAQDPQHTSRQAQRDTNAPQQHTQGTEDAVLKHGRSTMVSDIRAAQI
jgi:hypothetical protein